MLEAQPNPIANGENEFPMFVIVEVLDILLGLNKPTTDLMEKLIAVGQLLVDYHHAS